MIRRILAWLRRKPEAEVDEHALMAQSDPIPMVVDVPPGITRIKISVSARPGEWITPMTDPADREGA